MKSVAIVSLKGGVGKTTTTANLGAALALGPLERIVLVDLDRRNQLGLHLGLSPGVLGLAHASLRKVGWERVLHRGPGPLACVPYGALAPRDEEALAQLLPRTPSLLRDGLAQLAPDHDLALLDCAPEPAPLLSQALALADRVVAVLWPDPASFATLPQLVALLGRLRPERAAADLLLNFVDGARLGRDVRAVLAAEPGLSLLPFAIHRDAAVPEALGRQRPLVESAPGSQAAEDFRRAAEWLAEALTEGKSGPERSEKAEPKNGSEPIAFTDLVAQGAE